MSARSSARRLTLFALYPVFGLITPLLAIPVVTSRFGTVGWATVAIGLSLGSAGAVFVELAWGLDGPQRVAAADSIDRERLFRQSAKERLRAYIAVGLVQVIAAALVNPSAWAVTWLFALAALASGVSSAWFMSGVGRPGLALLVDSIPKGIATLLGCALMANGVGLWSYAVLLALSGISSPLLAARALGYALLRQGKSLTSPAVANRLSYSKRRFAFDALGARVTSSLYLSLPTTLVALVAAPHVIAQFSGADRLVRMGLAALVFIPTSLQAPLARTPPSLLRRQIRHVVLINAGTGLVAGITVTFALPLAVRLAMSDTTSINSPQATLEGLLVLATCTSRGAGGVALVRLGRVRAIFLSACAGAAVGVPLLLTLPKAYGATGAFLALAISEVIVAAVQLAILHRAMSRFRATPLAIGSAILEDVPPVADPSARGRRDTRNVPFPTGRSQRPQQGAKDAES